MIVKSGWSAEVATGVWDKADIELDEQDFVQLCHELGIHDLHITLDQKFELMENEAKRFVAAYVAIGHPDLRSDARSRIATLQERRSNLIQKIKGAAMEEQSVAE